MGIQDRDWYRDEMRRRQREEDAAEKRRKSPLRGFIGVRRVNRGQAPKLWGGDWHWSIQLLVWLGIVVLMLIAWRLVR